MLRKLLIVILLLTGTSAATAGEQVLSVNTGAGNAPFFISGESTLVMNGFDLNSLGIARPAVIDRVSIVVQTPVPGATVEVVIYEDADGGSPLNATLARRQQVTINNAGTFTVTLDTPVTVNQPVGWIGFYLPVGFVFSADTSGTSVLTYWAWTPDATFDLANLSSAAVFGPSDGSAPVNINMNGKARITAEITGAGGTTGVITPTVTTVDASAMQTYPNCPSALWDTADEQISYGDRINLHCQVVPFWQSPAAPGGYIRGGDLYDITGFKDNGVLANRFDVRITHCIRPDAADIDRAVIGVAYGAPRAWQILPSVRVGDLVCADVRFAGNLSYFVR